MKHLINITFVISAFLLASCTTKTEEVTDLHLGRGPAFALVQEDEGREVLAPQVRLRKLSIHLRGITPLREEYAALMEAITKNQKDIFFEQKTKEYLDSPKFIGKMIDRLDELFRLKTAERASEFRLETPNYKLSQGEPGYETLGALDQVFESLIAENKSWDKILTENNYRFVDQIKYLMASDLAFLNPVKPELPSATPLPGTAVSPYPKILEAKFDENDPKIAGAITTARFFSRYSTTNINRSRGRAAAIFRIFLCDDMRAVVEPKPEEEGELLKKAFPKPKPPVDGWHDARYLDDPHGTQESCMACHYKLDPLGKSFITIGSVMSPEPAPGALVYKRADGTLVEIKGEGFGVLAKAITQQPEYTACQVRHFWNWFIQSDVTPSTEEMTEMIKKFNAVGRRPKDFVRYLVNHKAFYEKPSEAVSLKNVRPILDRCNNCHSGVMEVEIPSFTQFPMGGTEANHLPWIKHIIHQLDLTHNGLNKKMPPKESAWQPTAEDLALLKQWISEGARDEEGNPSIDPKLGEELVKPKP